MSVRKNASQALLLLDQHHQHRTADRLPRRRETLHLFGQLLAVLRTPQPLPAALLPGALGQAVLALAVSFRRTYGRARKGRARVPNSGCLTSQAALTQRRPQKYLRAAWPRVGALVQAGAVGVWAVAPGGRVVDGQDDARAAAARQPGRQQAQQAGGAAGSAAPGGAQGVVVAAEVVADSSGAAASWRRCDGRGRAARLAAGPVTGRASGGPAKRRRRARRRAGGGQLRG